jgi:hypothetical protein
LLQFDDEGIARLTRAIAAVSPRKRHAWLADIARKLGPPTKRPVDGPFQSKSVAVPQKNADAR